jgi:hypothetical protein
MKLIGRILVLLLAALLVAGGTYALGNAGLLGSTAGGPPAGASFNGGTPPSGSFQGHGSGGEHASGGAGALVEIGKNLSVIAVIVALVASGMALVQRIWPGRGEKKPPTAAAAG